jgi:hypothetical protein
MYIRDEEVEVRVYNDLTTVTVKVVQNDLINLSVDHNPNHDAERAGLAPGEIPVELDFQED